MQTAFGVFIELIAVLLKILNQRSSVLQALGGLPQTVDLKLDVLQTQLRPKRMGHQNQLGIDFRTRKTKGFGPYLVELAVAPSLRALVAKHGTHVVQTFAAVIEHGMLHHRAHHTRRIFWAQRQLLTIKAVFKRVHLFFNNVSHFSKATHKKGRGL